MENSPTNLKSTLEDWLKRNFSCGYTSCIKINGRPILPPLMSEERRREMRSLRDMAMQVETKMTRRKDNNAQDDCAGGEAMYEGIVDELHFANSLPTSLAANSGEVPQTYHDPQGGVNVEQMPTTEPTCDMLREFDPLTVENGIKSFSPLPLLDLNSSDFPEKFMRSSVKTISKPGSADSSVALSYSTDLNNYMDMTEGSVDVSMPGSAMKSAEETGTNTPSTVRPDSADFLHQPGAPWREGKATYEELNNYLDSLLNNSSGSKKAKHVKDSNQNVVTSSASPPSSQATVSPLCLPPNTKSFSSDPPPPLISPQGSLQTRIVADNTPTNTTWKNSQSTENSSDFIQDCALSPVVGGDFQKSYEQKVQHYLQNLRIEEGNVRRSSCGSSAQQPLDKNTNVKDTFLQMNMINGDAPQIDAEGNLDGFNSVAPRLVRSNSYTLDSPSPMLLAHMEAELRKTAGNGSIIREKAASQCAPSRRVWDTGTLKNMPNWCTRPMNSSNTNSKALSSKKGFNRSISAQPYSAGNFMHSEGPADAPQKQLKNEVTSKNSPDQPKAKSATESSLKESDDKVTESCSQMSDNDNKDKVRSLLLQLQHQHNQEMEELINRQRKEKEAIRIALLEEQRGSPIKSPEKKSRRPLTSRALGNDPTDLLSQSPPTKDKVCIMERRNTSPSLYGKENYGDLQSQPLLTKKNSSVSLEGVPSCGGNAALIDLESDNRHHSGKHCGQDDLKTIQNIHEMNVAKPCHKQNVVSQHFNDASDMVSSFPPGDRPCSSQLESLTSSLPPEILSLQILNNEFQFNNASDVPCKAQSSSLFNKKTTPVSPDIASVIAPGVANGSPRIKRRSWCSRQLFPDDVPQSHPDWVTQSQQVQKHQAAARIQAGVRGYLTRRLLKTERVQNCITTIRDTIVCALQLQQECAPNVEPSDLQLHGRLIQQLSAACEELHNIFMALSVKKRMSIIAADRERLRVRTPRSRSRSSTGSRPLSRATQIALQRKMNQTDPSDSSTSASRASSANRSRRRSWATVESRVRASLLSSNAVNYCDVAVGCLSRTSAPASLPLQRSASAGSSRKPWR